MNKDKRVKACEDWMKAEGYQPEKSPTENVTPPNTGSNVKPEWFTKEVLKKLESDFKVKNCWFDEKEGLFHCLMQDGNEWTSPTGSAQDKWTKVPKEAPSVDPVLNPLSLQFGQALCDSEGFTKNDSGKLKWSLLPFKELEDVVKVLMKGAEKYTPDNWKKCDDVNRYKDALMRHVVAYIEGQKIDSVGSGGDDLPHLAHAICNCLFLMWFDNPAEEKAE